MTPVSRHRPPTESPGQPRVNTTVTGVSTGKVAAPVTVYTIPLTYTTPPLTKNGMRRMHYLVEAKRIRDIQDQIITGCHAQKIPLLDHPTFRLHYQPATTRRRDEDGLWPTSSAAIDGIVKAGVLVDDSSFDVDHLAPRIHPKADVARMWVEVTG